MQIVIDIDEKEYKRIIKGNWIGEAMAEIIENGTVLPDNPTNGDMIKAMFPNLAYKDGSQTERLFDSEDLVVGDLFNDWWNAPYERSADENSD